MTKTYIKNWFSNFLPFDEPFVYQGISYRTPENFYQAMKVEYDLETRRAIAMSTPSDAKKLGRKVNLRSDWEEIKTQVMEYVIREKFKPGTTWYGRLMSTLDEEIVEWNNWGDRVWGKTLDGKGENRLGFILMSLREEYQSNFEINN
jgi:ribA/ribD-fused uncharacterized protein